jgi:CDP-diacylglycerol--glycerol-3-phosphate 3-phosphatidyltransferase
MSALESGKGTVGRITRKVSPWSGSEFGPDTVPLGIWLSPSVDTPPVLTLFGSTNLNSRSANLDTELSFVMVTSSDSLRQTLQEEIQALHRWAVPWKGGERKVRCRTKAIVGLVGGML